MQRPGTPDELLDPAELWARGGTVAAIEAAALVSRDFSGCYSVHADGVTWDDGGGNEWTLSLLDGGWAVHLYEAKDVESRAARILAGRADDVLHGPRATLGPPWTKDHRMALAATVVAARG